MFSDKFEAAFSDFLETKEYDEAENVLFTAMRKGFIAGWLAAGGEAPSQARMFEIMDFRGREKT